MLTTNQFAVGLLCLCVALYVFYVACRTGRWGDQVRESNNRCASRRKYGAEYFNDPAPPTTDPAVPATATAAPPGGGEGASLEYDMQDAVDFSDVTISEKQREELVELRENTKQIQTVDERFTAAKRKTEEHGLKPGVLTNKKRRQLVEALVRRPFCGRRSRSWRTEFSDSLRGDVVPKIRNNTMGMMRMGRSDPSVDLHPGALGPMSGLSGQWVSEENIPDNQFDEVY
jgi:hypothetical protein